jgi:hypothetical protein
MNSLEEIRERYSSVPDDELRHIATTAELTADAHRLLQEELARRGIRDLNEYTEQMESEAAERILQKQKRLEAKYRRVRLYGIVGYVVCAVSGAIGIMKYFLLGDANNGIGIMVIAVLLVPFVWVSVRVRKAYWRFLLRP